VGNELATWSLACVDYRYVAWAVWMFWKSDPQCFIDLVRGTPDWATAPWCEYRDFKYYAWLLASMFGWPTRHLPVAGSISRIVARFSSLSRPFSPVLLLEPTVA